MAVDDTQIWNAFEQAVMNAADRVGPAVVKIETRQSRSRRGDQQGLGSGVIFNSDGEILTNAHVVAGSSRVLVTLPDGRSMPAGVLGSMPEYDLAVLRVGQSSLPVAHLSSAPLRVGQMVVAIGNPFGFDFTVTTGVISALNRSLPVAPGQKLEHLIQTDTPINPGNSGGPLVDVQGRVVGINTAILPYGQGIGFAVPASSAFDVIAKITTQHRDGLRRGALGISGLDVVLDEAARRDNKLEQGRGVLLLEVEPDGVAARASLRRGDILLALGDRTIEDVEGLRQQIQTLGGGRQCRVAFLREGRRREVTLVSASF